MKKYELERKDLNQRVILCGKIQMCQVGTKGDSPSLQSSYIIVNLKMNWLACVICKLSNVYLPVESHRRRKVNLVRVCYHNYARNLRCHALGLFCSSVIRYITYYEQLSVTVQKPVWTIISSVICSVHDRQNKMCDTLARSKETSLFYFCETRTHDVFLMTVWLFDAAFVG